MDRSKSETNEGGAGSAERVGTLRLAGLAESLERALSGQLWGLILFGSAARGETTDRSDLDVLLVADGLPSLFGPRIRFLRGLLPAPVQGKVSLIAKTRAEFEAAFPSYYLDIGLDGIILYDRDGYVTEKLTTIRDLIATAGLSRHRLASGFSWRWARPPAGHWRVDWGGVTGL